MDAFRNDRGESREFTMRPAIPGLRTLLIAAAILVAVIFVLSFLLRVTRIEAGHVGVEINLAGSQRGASEIPVRTGWVVYSPVNNEMFWAEKGVGSYVNDKRLRVSARRELKDAVFATGIPFAVTSGPHRLGFARTLSTLMPGQM